MKTHLQVEAPSSTAVNYVVTSKKHPSSRFITFAGHLIRTAVVFHAILLVLVKSNFGDGKGHRDDGYLGFLLQLTVLDSLITLIAVNLEWWVVILSSLTTFWLCLRRPYKEEALLVLQGMGVQTSTSSPYYFVGPTTTFISTTRIQDVIIHEAFKGLEVRFYLAIIVEGESEVVVVFPSLLPRLDVLQQVWRGARACLYAHDVRHV